MAKQLKQLVKLQIQAGKANPAPPVGTALGPHGVDIQTFCSQFNEATKDRMGEVVPVDLSIYEDRTFDFVLKTAPASDMIKKKINLFSKFVKNKVIDSNEIKGAKEILKFCKKLA